MHRNLRAIKACCTVCCGLLVLGLEGHQLDLFKDVNIGSSELIKALDFIAGEEKDCAWIPEYPIVANLINKMGLAVGCEVGVAYGGQSKYFLEHTQVDRLYSIDPYRHFASSGYRDPMNFEQHVYDIMFLKVQHALQSFGQRSVLLRETSEEAAMHFDDSELDFVYIDANHNYQYVLQDLYLWYPKVRSGGLVAGDDYVVWASVAQAVKEFTKTHNIKYQVDGNKWWLVKQ